MAITPGEIGKLLVPGLREIYGTSYNEHPALYPLLFEVVNSNRDFEEDQAVTGLGVMALKGVGGPISFDSFKQTYNTRYVNVTYSLAFRITMEAIMDNLYVAQMAKGAKMFARSSKETKDIVAHDVLNRAFNSAYTGGDGKELLATDHPHASGGTWQNELTNASDFSAAALEDLVTIIRKWTDDKGLFINAQPVSLHYAPDLEWEAEQVLGNMNRPGTAERDINPVATKGIIKGHHQSVFLSDPDAWFIKTDVPHGLRFQVRMGDTIDQENDFESKDMLFSIVNRFVPSWTDPRGLAGSPGK